MRGSISIVAPTSLTPTLVAVLRPSDSCLAHGFQSLPPDSVHTGAPIHFDGCDITFSIMLSDPEEYVGGGTYFRYLRKTIMLKKGQMLCHPGSLFHSGVDIESGTRLLMVGFLDGFNPSIPDLTHEKQDWPGYQKNLMFT